MEEIARLDHVYQYNELMGIETLHPLVSVVDLSEATGCRNARACVTRAACTGSTASS